MAIAVCIVEDDPHAERFLAVGSDGSSDFRLVCEWGDAESALAALPGLKPNGGC